MELEIQKNLLKPTHPQSSQIKTQVQYCKQILSSFIRQTYDNDHQLHTALLHRFATLQWDYLVAQIRGREIAGHCAQLQLAKSQATVLMGEHQEREEALLREIQIVKNNNSKVEEQREQQEKTLKLLQSSIATKEQSIKQLQLNNAATTLCIKNMNDDMATKLQCQETQIMMSLAEKIEEGAILKNTLRQKGLTLRKQVQENKRKLAEGDHNLIQQQQLNCLMEVEVAALEDQLNTTTNKLKATHSQISDYQMEIGKERGRANSLRISLQQHNHKQQQMAEQRSKVKQVRDAIAAALDEFHRQSVRIAKEIEGFEEQINRAIPVLQSQ